MKKFYLITCLFTLFFLPLNIAAELDFYGSINLGSWWYKYYRFYDDAVDTTYDANDIMRVNKTPKFGKDTLPETTTEFKPFGKFGCTYQNDRIEACIEFGINKNVTDLRVHGDETIFRVLPQKNFGFYMRKWYFVVHLTDNFSVLAGHYYSPTNLFGASNQAISTFNISYDFLMGKNIGCYGVYVGDPFGFWRTSAYNDVFFPRDLGQIDERIKNGDVKAMCLTLNFSPIQFLTFECGGGTVIGKHEDEEVNKQWKQNSYAWYFQTEFKFFDQINFTPEIGQYIYGPLSGFGKYFYGGFKTGVEF